MDWVRQVGFLQLQIVVAAVMTGVIWFVQVVTYPQFLLVEPANFEAYHESYTRAIVPLVAPLMMVELGFAALSCWFWRDHWLVVLASALVVFLWLSTGLVQVPLHDQLAKGWDRSTINTLVASNWWRTGWWTLRLGLLVLVVKRLSRRG